jgi:hypothetical protein
VTGRSIRSIRVFAGLVTLCSLPVAAPSAQDSYITLFNGKDLSGWVPVGTPQAFIVKEDAI